MAKKLYWQSQNGLGSGKGSIQKGDEFKNLEDTRVKKWLKDGILSDQKVVNFSAKKQTELDEAQFKILEQSESIRDLQTKITELESDKTPSGPK